MRITSTTRTQTVDGIALERATYNLKNAIYARSGDLICNDKLFKNTTFVINFNKISQMWHIQSIYEL